MFNKPFFSVIMPVFNSELYLKEAIESVCRQSFEDWELILVDDGSTDHSGRICDHFADKDPRIIVRHTPNGGVSRARNTGISCASGNYICFVDSDDLLKEKCLETVHEQLEDHDLLVFGYEIFPEHSLHSIGKHQEYDSLSAMGADYELIRFNTPWNSTWNKVWRSSILWTGVPFDTTLSLGEDLTFNLSNLPFCKTVKFIPECLYLYRVGNKDTLSHSYRSDHFSILKKLWDIEKKTFEVVPDVYPKICNEFVENTIQFIEKTVFASGFSSPKIFSMIQNILLDDVFTEAINNVEISHVQSVLPLELYRKKKTLIIFGYYMAHKAASNFLKRIRELFEKKKNAGNSPV